MKTKFGNVIAKEVRVYNYKRNEVIDKRTGKRYNLKEFMKGKWEQYMSYTDELDELMLGMEHEMNLRATEALKGNDKITPEIESLHEANQKQYDKLYSALNKFNDDDDEYDEDEEDW